jgi:hypothetical protein
MANWSAAAVRAADTLLRGVGGRKVLLRMPAPAIAGDDGEQLGIATPEFQDLPLWPVVFRRVRATMNPATALEVGATAGKGTQFELLVSATAVGGVVGSLGYESAAVLFRDAFGVLVDEALLEVESATWSEVGGIPYLYRLLLRAPLALLT